jgi:hypothetical protein
VEQELPIKDLEALTLLQALKALAVEVEPLKLVSQVHPQLTQVDAVEMV